MSGKAPLSPYHASATMFASIPSAVFPQLDLDTDDAISRGSSIGLVAKSRREWRSHIAHKLLICRQAAVEGLEAALRSKPNAMTVMTEFETQLLLYCCPHKAMEPCVHSEEKSMAENVAESVLTVTPATMKVAIEGEWERRHGGFLAAAKLVAYGETSEAFRVQVLEFAKVSLEDPETRVRRAVAVFLEELTRKDGMQVYLAVKDLILGSIGQNFNREGNRRVDDVGVQDEVDDTSLFRPKPTKNPSLADIKHDTEGWKSLETSFHALQRIMVGAGELFSPYLTESLLELIYRCTKHLNRFVRETAYFACGTICSIFSEEKLTAISETMTTMLAKGLSDNWSQVRFAASVGTREFLSHAPHIRANFYSKLVPAMCLNRYYVAEGVRLYSIDTWRNTMGEAGKDIVAQYIDFVVPYYVKQAAADNHAVREAACHCIAELGLKVEKDAVRPHVKSLLDTLVLCFKDESWPVRDAACMACGNFVASFPLESKSSMPDLYHLWFEHLSDNIPSVREDSAVALGKVLRAYGDEAAAIIVKHMELILPMATKQPEESKMYSQLCNTTTFGVAAKKCRDNDAQLHSNQAMFSCGSLAPKMRRAGCMDHGFVRAKEPWESSDGAVYMMRELSAFNAELVVPFMSVLAEIANVRSFAHHVKLLENIWRQVPVIARNMGKRPFKRVVMPLIEPMFYTLTRTENRLAMSSAGECIGKLCKYLGTRIFRGRLEPDQMQTMDQSPFVDQQYKFVN